MRFVLAHQEARQRAIQAVTEAPEGYEVVVQEVKRNLEQNAKLHASITEYGNYIGWRFNGVSVDMDDLKTILMSAYRKSQGRAARFVVGLDGNPINLSWRTSKLTKAECAELIEMVEALCAGAEV